MKNKACFHSLFRADLERASKCLIHVMETHNAVGVAAPQIGLPWQMFVVAPVAAPRAGSASLCQQAASKLGAMQRILIA